MWASYKPTPAFGCTRSRAPYQVTENHPYSDQAPRYQSGVKFFPDYRTYINAMCEGDYFYLGYNQVSLLNSFASSSIPTLKDVFNLEYLTANILPTRFFVEASTNREVMHSWKYEELKQPLLKSNI